MQKTKQIIIKHEADFPEFKYYYNIIFKVEGNIEKMPDISIESCKSLIEGISKTILNKLNVEYKEKGRDADSPKQLWKKVLENIQNLTHELDLVEKSCKVLDRTPEFITNTVESISVITEIRNKRGDISHGKAVPKLMKSDSTLAQYISDITDATVYYLLNIFFNLDWSYLDEIKYEDNPEFNDLLDEENNLEDILYSRALFDQDLTAYEAQLDDFIENIV